MEARESEARLCTHCGASSLITATKCWVCGNTDLSRPEPAAQASPAKPQPIWYLGDDDLMPPAARSPVVSYAKPVVALVGVLLACAFLAGMWREAPGAAVALALVIGVTILATVGRGGPGSKRSDPGGSMAVSILRIFAGVATTLATIALVVVVAVVAMFAFLLISCLHMLGK